MKKSSFKVFFCLPIILMAAGLCADVFIGSPHRRMRDMQWLETAMPEEQRQVAHRILSLPIGNHHDAFLVLIRHGTAASTPYLLNRLKNYGDTDFIECSHDHCVEALKTITGLDAGYRYADWKLALAQDESVRR
jgi:hypothetical protein